MVSRDFARRPSDRGFTEDVDLYYKLLDSFLKVGYSPFCACRLLFLPGESTGSWASRFVLGPVSFLTITRSLFFFASKGVKLEVSKIYYNVNLC